MEILDRLNPKYLVFYATEDYSAEPKHWKSTTLNLRRQLQSILDRCDRAIAVSAGVADSYSKQMRLLSYPDALPNGCDFRFWYETGAHAFCLESGPAVALYQGGINDRLDFGLLASLADLMPNWTFRFCGRKVNDNAAWNALKNGANDDLVGALTLRGFIAPFVFDGPIDRAAFETYVAKVLVPELAEGDVVVMDNLSSHKEPRVHEMIGAAGAALLYLPPPYNPDFSPIEMALFKLKALLRKAAEEPSRHSGTPSDGSSSSSRRKRPQTTSLQQDTILPNRKKLYS